MKIFTFHKEGRLVHRKEIDELFRQGHAFNVPPLRIIYLQKEPVQIKFLPSVPRKRFKKAVTRNRIKRLIREAYRLNKSQLSNLSIGLNIAFVYIEKEESVTFEIVNKAVVTAIQRLSKCLEN